MIGDRELDREIGKKIFAYWLYHYNKGVESSCYWALLDSELNCVGQIMERGLPHRKSEAEAWGDMPHFSSELEDAWRVVDEVRGVGFDFGIWSVRDVWVANFEQGEQQEYEAEGETPAEAICLAALKLVAAGEFVVEASDYA